MDVLGVLPFFPYPCPPVPFFQVGALGELLVAYVTVVGGNAPVPPLAPIGQWHFIPTAALELQGTVGMMNVVPPAVAALMVDPGALSGSAPPLQWIGGGTGVFLPTPPFMLSTAYQTPNFPPNRVVSSAAAGKKVDLKKAPAVKGMVKLDTEAGPSKVTTMQDHVKAAAIKETQPETEQKGKNKGVMVEEEEEATAAVDDFPELLLLPEEWTY